MMIERGGKTYYIASCQLVKAWVVKQKYMGARRIGSIEPMRNKTNMTWRALSKSGPQTKERFIGIYASVSEAFREIVIFYHEKVQIKQGTKNASNHTNTRGRARKRKS